MNRTFVLTIATIALATSAAQAAGTANRVWVSGHGVDAAGCGPPTTPCRSLQYAHDSAVAAGGEIDILDPAGYGAITITKALSIVNDGVGTAGVQATGGGAITVNAGSNDAVYLRGLNIDGAHYAGAWGIVFNSGASLTIADCVVRHFALDGIMVTPTSGTSVVSISNTTSADNQQSGLYVTMGNGTAALFLNADHLAINDNSGEGVSIDDGIGSGTVNVAMANLVVMRNASIGMSVQASANDTAVTLDSAFIAQNQQNGLMVAGDAVLHLSRSALDQNEAYGLNNGTATPGAIYSTGDNRFEGNLDGPTFGPAFLSDALK